MKANEAPERIYLFENSITETPDDRWLSKRSGDEDIEYTRTDAFIKKAENFLEMLGYGFTITDNITHANYDKEQLIADFRKYMEGEQCMKKENTIQINGISEELFNKALNIYFDLYKDRTKAIRELARATENKKISISRDYLNDNRFEI